jgi:DNA polymerase I-like protein with 3'-5' exonuclease and polymerase domains
MSSLLAVDTETTGVSFYDEAFGASLYDGTYSHWLELPSERAEVSARINTAGYLIFHNAKFDLQKLILAGVIPRRKRGIHDTEALAHLLDEHRPKKLKYLTRELLKEETPEEDELVAYVRKKANGINKKIDGFSKVPRPILIPYAIKDAEYTWRLFHLLYPQVQAYPDLLRLYEMEMDLTWALLEMEADGLGVSEAYVNETIKDYSARILRAEWAIQDILGLEVWYPEKSGQKTPEGKFNPNSNPQIKAYYEGVNEVRDSYDAHNLREINDDFAQALLELRALKKMYSTYLIPMREETVNGILHPNIRQHGTVTGRMSSGRAEA